MLAVSLALFFILKIPNADVKFQVDMNLVIKVNDILLELQCRQILVFKPYNMDLEIKMEFEGRREKKINDPIRECESKLVYFQPSRKAFNMSYDSIRVMFKQYSNLCPSGVYFPLSLCFLNIS